MLRRRHVPGANSIDQGNGFFVRFDPQFITQNPLTVQIAGNRLAAAAAQRKETHHPAIRLFAVRIQRQLTMGKLKRFGQIFLVFVNGCQRTYRPEAQTLQTFLLHHQPFFEERGISQIKACQQVTAIQ